MEGFTIACHVNLFVQLLLILLFLAQCNFRVNSSNLPGSYN